MAVDKEALTNAWHDYWQHPEWSAKYIAEKHGIKYSRLYTQFRRAGYIQRRKTPHSQATRLDASQCTGYQVFLCADCPCPPVCKEFNCRFCKHRYTCACTNATQRPVEWEGKLAERREEKRRNDKAVRMFHYAWASVENPLEGEV